MFKERLKVFLKLKAKESKQGLNTFCKAVLGSSMLLFIIFAVLYVLGLVGVLVDVYIVEWIVEPDMLKSHYLLLPFPVGIFLAPIIILLGLFVAVPCMIAVSFYRWIRINWKIARQMVDDNELKKDILE